MAGSIITVDPRIPVSALKRTARERVKRDGAVQFAGATGDRRQWRQLRRLRDRLVAEAAFDVLGPTDHGDGAVYVSVKPAGAQHAGVWGYPMIAAVQAQLDPADVEILDIDP